jgi:hypothetical protein
MIKLDDGTIMNVVLNNVKYVPNLAPYNLFSITQAILSGWMLGNEGKSILLKNGKSVLKFNKMLKTKSGYVGGGEILPRVDDNIAAPALSPGKGVDIMKFHDMLVHVSESTTRKILMSALIAQRQKLDRGTCQKEMTQCMPNTTESPS